MKIDQFPVLGLLVGPLVVFSSMSQAADCTRGDTRQVHKVGNFNFVTNSWVEENGKLRRYVSCVGNFDQGSDLLVTWFIAGPTGTYVPYDDVSTTPRMSNDLSPRPVDGCIKYGNLGDSTPAQFMGSAADEVENRQQSSCRPSSIAEKQTLADPGVPVDGWKDEVHVFFPSNPDSPYDTMLEVTGTIGITPGDGKFQSFFSYSAERYKGRLSGNPDDVLVQPVFLSVSENFYAAFFNENKKWTPLGTRGDITFTVGDVGKDWVPVTAYYAFVDKEARILGTIPMPMFGPQRR